MNVGIRNFASLHDFIILLSIEAFLCIISERKKVSKMILYMIFYKKTKICKISMYMKAGNTIHNFVCLFEIISNKNLKS